MSLFLAAVIPGRAIISYRIFAGRLTPTKPVPLPWR